MKRNIDLKEISDGRLYGPNDMVKADCKGCAGCSACCHGMGNSIVLTPLDIYRLEKECSCSFGELLTKGVELNFWTELFCLILPCTVRTKPVSF